MSNTPVTMNERRVRTLLACVQFTRDVGEAPGLLEDDDLLPAEHMLVAALARIKANEERIAVSRRLASFARAAADTTVFVVGVLIAAKAEDATSSGTSVLLAVASSFCFGVYFAGKGLSR